jgi:HEPN domain-containing protein
MSKDDHSPEPPPHSGPLFEAMMADIDAKLMREGIPISYRPVRAGSEISLRYKIPMPIAVTDLNRLPPEMRRYAPLSIAVSRWYSETYGDRLKIDMCPGRTVVRLDGDLYVLKIPRLLGSVTFGVSREFLAQPTLGRSPMKGNIIQLIEHLTPTKASRLSDAALKAAVEAFETALWASYTLEVTSHDLLRSARGDVASAVTALMSDRERSGESKWASLQAAEKTMKAAIALHGGQFPFTHDLSKLAQVLEAIGVALKARELISAIQCTPGIRYGEERCSQNDALAAHRASLALVNRLREAGARFNSGLG